MDPARIDPLGILAVLNGAAIDEVFPRPGEPATEAGDAGTAVDRAGVLADRPAEDRVTGQLVSRKPVSPAAGSLIGGVYRVLAPLGSGSMGVVLLAHDESLDRQVAVKLIQPALVSLNLRERFAEEARAMARVSHPNVLQIHALGVHDDVPYFVMEYVDGPTLEQWLFTNGSPPELDVALGFLEGICRGVIAIHRADTIHLDLKPSNILLDAHLRPRVADLGVATICRPDRPSKPEIVGTPHYMAPEIAFRREVPESRRARADVYSIGCLAYELLTGRPPFCGESDFETMALQESAQAVPPSQLRPGLAPEFDEVVLRALAKDSVERTPSVEALLRELSVARIGDRDPARILIAEDNDDFRDTLELALAAEWPSADIVSCANGEDALEAFDRRRPSVVLLDLRMPGLDGMELTARLRSRDPGRTVPIVVLTASGGPDEWARLSALGANGFLVKPVIFADVIAMMRRCLKADKR